MTTTTQYGTYIQLVAHTRGVLPSSDNLRDDVAVALTDFAGDYDVDALAEDWRAAINAALEPLDVTLARNGDVYGPVGLDYATITSAAATVLDDNERFWEIAALHDRTDA